MSQRKRQKTDHDVDCSIYESCEVNKRATCGVIENVTVKNFMCHEHLSVDFKEGINLVQGRNGSGKSAILTAVVVALGGNTRTTNRGSSMKELIKYDKHVATVNISMKNSGKDAFKPDVYGSSISIERKIMSSGSSSYSIRGASGKVVSNKKEELKRICDFFNLIVENPLMVLNQDMSRAFLNSQDPKNLYKFFFQATQLQQMTDCYRQLTDCLDVSEAMIKDHGACYSTVEKEYEEVKHQFQFCQRQATKRQKLKDTRRELVWSKISEIEEGKEQGEKALKDITTLMDKFKEKQQSLQELVKESSQKHKEWQKKFENLTQEIKANRDIHKEKSEVQSRAKLKYKQIQMNIEKEHRRLEVTKKEIESLDITIKRDYTEVQRVWEEHNKHHKEEMEKVQNDVSNLEQIKKTEETHLSNIQHTLRIKHDHMQQLEIEEMNKKRNINELELELKSLQTKNTNSFTVFGTWVQPLLEKIDMAFKQGKFSAAPVGPLGAYVEMRDNRWTHIAEMVIGNKMSAFCVNSHNDEKVLRNLFYGIHFGAAPPTIICCKFRPRHSQAEVSRFEVQSESYPSLWSVMNIKNDVVANLLLDRNSIEALLLIPTAEEAGQILKNISTVPPRCKMAYTLNGDRYIPDPNYRVYSGPGQRPARFLQVSVGERAQDVSRDILIFKEDIMGVRQSHASLKDEYSKLKGDERLYNDKIKAHRVSIHKLNAELTQLKNQVGPPPPPNVTQIEEDKKEQEARRDHSIETLRNLKENLKSAEDEFRAAEESLNEFHNKVAGISESARSMEKEMTASEEEHSKRSNQLKAVEKKIKDQKVKKVELEKKVDEESTRLEKEAKMAEQFLPRVTTRRTPAEIEREYKTLEEKLNKEQANHGDPVAIAEKYKEMTEKKRILKQELEESQRLINKLRKSLEDRFSIYNNFRKVVSIIVKTSFMGILSSRNLKGRLVFDFVNETLTIRLTKKDGDIDADDVDTSSKKNTLKKNQQEKLAMMSGGERSFATVALILALWEVMDSPVRMLDEFDVFMDIVARRQSLDMIITNAKTTTQYIYLTPLEINQSQKDRGINIFRMPDPERESQA